MGRALLFAVLFAVIGLIVFALLAPLLFPNGDQRKLGAAAGPIIFVVAGGTGAVVGWVTRKK
jgi:hypothetical protein